MNAKDRESYRAFPLVPITVYVDPGCIEIDPGINEILQGPPPITHPLAPSPSHPVTPSPTSTRRGG